MNMQRPFFFLDLLRTYSVYAVHMYRQYTLKGEASIRQVTQQIKR